MLPKTHLTSQSRMSGYRSVVTPSWLSGAWWSFLYSSVYSWHLFLIYSASVSSIPFLPFFGVHLCMKCTLVSLIFLKRSLVFSIPLFSSIFLHSSLRRVLLSLLLFFGTLHSNGYIIPFLLCFSLFFFSQLFVRPPQTAILLYLHFFFLEMVLIPVSCTMS